MLEIAAVSENINDKELYGKLGEELIVALTQHCLCLDDSTQGLIKYGTVSYPANKNINVPIIYGDLFFIEALGKILGKESIF